MTATKPHIDDDWYAAETVRRLNVLIQDEDTRRGVEQLLAIRVDVPPRTYEDPKWLVTGRVETPTFGTIGFLGMLVGLSPKDGLSRITARYDGHAGTLVCFGLRAAEKKVSK